MSAAVRQWRLHECNNDLHAFYTFHVWSTLGNTFSPIQRPCIYLLQILVLFGEKGPRTSQGQRNAHSKRPRAAKVFYFALESVSKEQPKRRYAYRID